MSSLRFHAGAFAAALLVAVAAAGAAIGIESLEVRGGAPRLLTTGELWMLVLFVAGVLAVLLALSALLGGWPAPSRLKRGLAGSRDPGVLVAGTDPDPDPGGRAVALWILEAGAALLLVYAVAWLAGAARWGG